MQDEPENIELILPFGEMLRAFTEQSFITKNDLKKLLKDRGIYTFRSEKQDYIPILMTCLLSPKEFDFLRECRNSKEDNPKTATQTILWDSQQTTLFDSLPNNIDLNDIIREDFINYTITGSPNFIIIDNDLNNICLEFEIERKDLTKNWATTKNRFKGSLRLIKPEGKNKLRIIMTNTASETKQVNNKLTKWLIQYFKTNKLVSQEAELEKILFSNFTNTERINFFMGLTKGLSTKVLNFKDVVDIEFCPQKGQTPSLPEGIKWLERHINKLKLNGESLHETFFVKEKEYHNYIILYKIEAKYTFSLEEATGSCVFDYSFPDYAKDKEEKSELEVNVSSLQLDDTFKHKNRNLIKEQLLREVDSVKMNIFEKYKNK